MWKAAVYGGAAVATSAVLSGLVYYGKPSLMLRMYFRMKYGQAGVKLRQLNVEGRTFTYLEKGVKSQNQPSLLLVHGFTGDKTNWLPVLERLPATVHTVALDLPGHGDTGRLATDCPSLAEQSKCLKKFVDALKLNTTPLHVVGQSMGGALVGVYAASYPEDVASLTLVCPFMRTPNPSQMIKDLMSGKQSLLLADTPQGIQDMMDLCAQNAPKLAHWMLRAIQDMRRPHIEYFSELSAELAKHENSNALVNHIQNITCPCQVVWGENDLVVNVSGADTIAQKFPSCKIHRIPNCGHTINFERSKLLTQLVLDFITPTSMQNSRL